jgi:hypothetical protein
LPSLNQVCYKAVDEEYSHNVLGLVKEEAEQHVQMLSKVAE